MKRNAEITLKSVQTVYGGAEGALWELVMGEQIHIGGMTSSIALADAADIVPGMKGVDLCCCNGAGMRFLVRFRNVSSMQGIDATEKAVAECARRCKAEGLSDRIGVTYADACATGLSTDQADFVWGEDAWCYVEDKSALIAEASRIVSINGKIAFTDWVEGEGLSDDEARRYMGFMKFPSILTISEYTGLLKTNGCLVDSAVDTHQFARHIDLYLDMLTFQLTYDALKTIGFDRNMMQTLAQEMAFVRDLAHAGKIMQARFVATKRGLNSSMP